MKQAVHDGTRQWSNVGHVCTRCLHEVKVGEKSERFYTKAGRLRVRHVTKCGPRRATVRETTVRPGGCTCLECTAAAYTSLTTRINNLQYAQYEALYPYATTADQRRRMALVMARDFNAGLATQEALQSAVVGFRQAYEALWQESRRFIDD